MAEYKDKWCQEAYDRGRDFEKGQLTKAKKLVRNLLNIIATEVTLNPLYLKLTQEAEQFLRETDIDDAIQKANRGLNLDKITEEIEQDIKEQFLKNDGCPDCFCEDCTKDCGTKKLGLVDVEK